MTTWLDWRDPWYEDALAWRQFDDAYQAEWDENQGKLLKAMNDLWNSFANDSEPPDMIYINADQARSLGLVLDAPWWRRAWWRVRYYLFLRFTDLD